MITSALTGSSQVFHNEDIPGYLGLTCIVNKQLEIST